MKSYGSTKYGIKMETIRDGAEVHTRLVDGYIAKKAGVAKAAKRKSNKARRQEFKREIASYS